jgi:hypothetical protein
MISIIGLTACRDHAVHQSGQAPVTSVPSPSVPPAAVADLPAPASAPIPPAVSATPVIPKPPQAANKPTPEKAVVKPSAAKPAKEKAAPASTPILPGPLTAAVPGPPPAQSSPKPQLDFKAMEQRLRNTSAIGVFTKLSIKNQVDDLLKAFKGYHAGQTPPTLDDLHQRYDGLLLKVVSLVQNDDPDLASSISASRTAIWERLSNRESFQAI